MQPRSIIHLNQADFAVAVERAARPGLRGRPVIVAPFGLSRARVYDMSEEAYRAGVEKGMLLTRARRMIRDAELRPPDPELYARAMRALVKQALPYSPLVEQPDQNGHLFLDVTGTGRLFGPPADVAHRIRRAVRRDLRLDPIWSVAPNKLVAKVATRVVKPDGEYVVRPGDEEAFLRPLPLGLLPGVDRETLRRLREFNLRRVGEMAALALPQLEVMAGRWSLALYRAARGIDDAPVRPAGRAHPVVIQVHEFAEDTNDAALVEAALCLLVERAGFELRTRDLAARRMRVTMDYSDGVRAERLRTLRTATAANGRLHALAQAALKRAWTRRVRLRKLSLSCERLAVPSGQLELFPQEPDRTPLDHALDRVRERFGADAVRAGRALVGDAP